MRVHWMVQDCLNSRECHLVATKVDTRHVRDLGSSREDKKMIG